MDLDGDGREELLTTDRLGRAHWLDGGLEPRKVVEVTPNRYDAVWLHLWAAEGLDEDGRLELVFGSMESEFVAGLEEGSHDGAVESRHFYNVTVKILDDQFRERAAYVVAESRKANPGLAVRVADLDGDGASEVIALTDKAEVLRFRP